MTVEGPVAGPEWQSVCRIRCGCFQNRLSSVMSGTEILSVSLRFELNPELSLKNIDWSVFYPLHFFSGDGSLQRVVCSQRGGEWREKPNGTSSAQKKCSISLLVILAGWSFRTAYWFSFFRVDCLMSLMVLHKYHALTRGHLLTRAGSDLISERKVC